VLVDIAIIRENDRPDYELAQLFIKLAKKLARFPIGFALLFTE
jgi:hypothetical protein